MSVKRLPDGRVDLGGRIPPVAMSLASTAWNRTGAWRSREPRFQDRTAPCVAACPLGQDLPDQLRLAAQGRLRDAAQLLLSVNPMPATTGRVCPHPCARACNRAALDGAVDVSGVERALGDALVTEGVAPRPEGRLALRVAVVGAGPAGLAAAHRLALAGADVRLLAREARPGGLLVTGIPPYRLPRGVLKGEIARILAAGVRFEGGFALAEGGMDALLESHDAVLVAIGRHLPRPLGVPGADAAGVVDGLALLDAVHRGAPVPPGQEVVVVGGGNTALDCARTLLRLGRKVTVAYRRGREDMPAIPDEIEEALEEGVHLETWALPVEVVVRSGRARWLNLARARPGVRDASGRPRPERIPGGDFVMPADLVVVAAGEELDPAGLPEEVVRGGSVAAPEHRTAVPRLFAAGDCLPGGGTVAHALASGLRAADALLEALAGIRRAPPALEARGASPEVVGPDRIRAHHVTPAPPRRRGRANAPMRLGGGEVRFGFDPDAARAEAARCLSCGSCTGCDVCYLVCPDRAVVRGAPGGYAADAERCKGCGICAEECPRGVVTLAEVEVR
ncbi:FAD-dependent oxidoreductase [Anaeromyxobacter oryzae]|uniref:Glutamate synthase n=1 Tax=Anaeromyxobacter oryzae TaxID=2918170 RepID=A0ABM7WY16_9BACT|nr:FAD-dependent oxidoreductase [Anaeromyxobacter oryzae]BDG04420.1 glutamate synthase [Anaeromyxobacter oryzae]